MSNKYTIVLNDIKSGQTVNLLTLCHQQNPDMDECSSIENVAITRFDLPGSGMLIDTINNTFGKFAEAVDKSMATMEPALEGAWCEHVISETRGCRKVELALVNTQLGTFKSFGDASKIVLEVSLVNTNLR